jgi:uncharacterized glyoxalase superfamily protein PhnB
MKLEPLLYVADLKASIKFYHQVLGFNLGELYANEEQATYAPVFIDGDKLMLVQGGHRVPGFHKHGMCGSGIQLFVQVPKVDEAYERLAGKVKVMDEIEDKTWGDREFTIADPDGYLITFYSSL